MILLLIVTNLNLFSLKKYIAKYFDVIYSNYFD